MDSIFIDAFSLGGDGPTIALKDCIDVAGHPTRCGSRALAAAPPAARHAAVVQAVLDGGCRIVGKVNMHELAYGVTGINPWTGTPRNSRHPGIIPGGSSSGSAAAVAAGLADIALGTDTGGSIRMPAACCGVYGFKPTFGRISREGVMPRESSLDCVGPLAASLDAIEEAMCLIDPGFVREPTPDTVTIACLPVAADPEITASVNAAIAEAGASFRVIPLPGIEEAYNAGITIIAAEALAAYGGFLGSGSLGADVEQRLFSATLSPSAGAGERSEAVRRSFAAAVDAILADHDAIALPTLPEFPPRIEDAGDARGLVRMTEFVRPFNLSGHPAISIPLAVPSRRPAGLQLVGRRGGDARLCAIARLFDRAAGAKGQA